MRALPIGASLTCPLSKRWGRCCEKDKNKKNPVGDMWALPIGASLTCLIRSKLPSVSQALRQPIGQHVTSGDKPTKQHSHSDHFINKHLLPVIQPVFSVYRLWQGGPPRGGLGCDAWALRV